MQRRDWEDVVVGWVIGLASMIALFWWATL